MEVYVATVRECGEGVRHHRHLNVASDAQFAVDTLLGCGRVGQLVVGMAQLLQLLATAEVVKGEEGEGDDGDDHGSLYLQLLV